MMYFCYAVTAYISRALTGYSFRRQSTAVCAGRRLRLVCSARRSTGAVREIISRSFLSGFYNLVHADCPCLRESIFLLQRDDTAGIVLYSRAEVPSSRPQAMKGSPEGQVPLALSAQDRPPRRRRKRQFQHLRGLLRVPHARRGRNGVNIKIVQKMIEVKCFDSF